MRSRRSPTAGALARVLGGTLRADVDPLNATNFHTDHLFGLWVAQDLQRPDAQHALPAAGRPRPAGPRLLPVADSPRMAELRAKYQAHVAAMLRLAGIADASRRGRARSSSSRRRWRAVHATRARSADVQKRNNPWTREALAAKAPGLDWNAFFDAAGLRAQPEFIVWHPAR